MKRASFEIVAGFVLSGVLHAALLLFFSAREMDSGQLADRTVPLQLSMFHAREQAVATPELPARTVQTAAEPAPQPKSVIDRKPETDHDTRPVIKPQPRSRKPASRPAVNSASPPLTNPEPAPQAVASLAPDTPAPPPTELIASLENQYKSRLHALIEANKRYPRIARKMHYQGRAKVSFVIRRNGQIEQIQLVESTGYAVLDNAVIDAIRSVSGQLPFPEDVQRSEWAFTIPLDYHLQ